MRICALARYVIPPLALGVVLVSCGGPSAGGRSALPVGAAGGAPTQRAGERLYVTNGFGEPDCGYAVLGFDANQSGDVPPLAKLCDGSSVHGLTQSSEGTLYVADATLAPSPSYNPGIAVYAPDVGSGSPPIRLITCGGLIQPLRLALDSAGNLYVTNGTILTEQNVLVFPPDANGCVTGNRILSGPHTGLSVPVGITVHGDVLYVATEAPGACGPPEILEFRTLAGGDSAPFAVLSGARTGIFSPHALASDGDGNLYVLNTTLTSVNILVFAPGASGDVAPIRVIEGPGLTAAGPDDISVRADGTLFVVNNIADDVSVYAPEANGDAPPIRIIGGSQTTLRFPARVAVSPQ